MDSTFKCIYGQNRSITLDYKIPNGGISYDSVNISVQQTYLKWKEIICG